VPSSHPSAPLRAHPNGWEWPPIFGAGFPLRCFQRLPRYGVAARRLPCQTTGKLEAAAPRSSRTEGTLPSGDQHPR